MTVPELEPVRVALIIGAGGWAGFINSIVGSGTLVSFPTLVGVGFDPITANVTNNIGLFPGSASAAYGFRSELRGHGRAVAQLGVASGFGALIGAALVFRLPTSTYRSVVPYLVLGAVLLVIVQPLLMRVLRARRVPEPQSATGTARVLRVGPASWIGVALAGVYGGYFGAGQGIVLIGTLGVLLDAEIVTVNAIKNVLVTIVGLVAGVFFVIRTDVSWFPTLLLACGSITGGVLGAQVGRRIRPPVLRALVVLIGLAASALLLRNS